MPKTLGIWKWGCPKRGDAQNAVTAGVDGGLMAGLAGLAQDLWTRGGLQVVDVLEVRGRPAAEGYVIVQNVCRG